MLSNISIYFWEWVRQGYANFAFSVTKVRKLILCGKRPPSDSTQPQKTLFIRTKIKTNFQS